MTKIDLRNKDSASHARALIALMETGVPARWGVTTTPIDETSMGKTLIQQAFGICTSDFYECIKGICRNDLGAAQRFYNIVSEDIPGAMKVTLEENGVYTQAGVSRYSITHHGQHEKMSIAWGIATLRVWIAHLETPVEDV